MPPESLRCKECKTTYPLDARYVCERCFGPLEVAYESRTDVDPAELKRRIQAGPHSLWRYGDFLPVQTPPKGTLPAGWTPLLKADRLAEELGLGEVWIKNDAANPTHSFKDRVVSVALARARELGFTTIACASTGNLANAVAAHAAAAGLESYVFIPDNLEEQKILATGIYGTNLVAVNGNYDDVNRLCTELSGEHAWAFVNINMRPYYAEGSKTLAYETVEQLGWKLPGPGRRADRIWVAVHEDRPRVQEWIELGLVDGELPTFNGAQARGCSPVATAFENGHDFCQPVKPDTIAKSLAIGNPADGPYALDLARRSEGGIDRSPTTRSRTASGCSLGRPASSPRRPVVSRRRCWRSSPARGDIDPDERVVAYITGEGLKTLDVARAERSRPGRSSRRSTRSKRPRSTPSSPPE